MDETDAMARGAGTDSAWRESHASAVQPLDGRVDVVDPQPDVIERRNVDPGFLLRIDRLHQIDFDRKGPGSHRYDVFVDVFRFASEIAGELEAERIDPEPAKGVLVGCAHRDLLNTEYLERTICHASAFIPRLPPMSTWDNLRLVKTSLTGIKPTHLPHLGNYLGAIRPALSLVDRYRTLYFIADYHALTSVRDAQKLRGYIRDVAATWLACGLDPERTLLYRQSDVPEVFELTWVLGCLLATGQLERGHAYKDALARGGSPNAGIFNYPVLMAADILLYDTDVVPIGKDQKQHLELTRDVASRLNHSYGENTLVVPEALITEAPLVPGTDGQKMSKSRGNGIPLFETPKELRKVIMSITTSSEALEDPKSAEDSTVYELYSLIAPERAPEMKQKLEAGGYGWGHAKQDLYEAIEAEIGPKREAYLAIRDDETKLDALLHEGADKARSIAKMTMRRVRKAVGID